MVGVAALLSVESAEKEVADSNPTDERAPTNDAKRKFSKDDIEERDGVSYVRGETTPFTGTTIRCFRDGSKFEEIPYLDGKKHGTMIDYHANGSKWSETPWVKGKEHGRKIVYHKDGYKWSEIPYRNGKRHGTVILYREDGSKVYETPFVDGKPHGTVIYYHEDGSKRFERVYENGKKISEKEWDKDGKPK